MRRLVSWFSLIDMPNSSRLAASGLVSAKPIAVIRSGLTPRLMRKRTTDEARPAESSQLLGSWAVEIGTFSVWPSTSTR